MRRNKGGEPLHGDKTCHLPGLKRSFRGLGLLSIIVVYAANSGHGTSNSSASSRRVTLSDTTLGKGVRARSIAAETRADHGLSSVVPACWFVSHLLGIA